MKSYIVMRSPVLPEDEGRHSIVAHYENKELARAWIAAQKDEYFKPGDYYIIEVPPPSSESAT